MGAALAAMQHSTHHTIRRLQRPQLPTLGGGKPLPVNAVFLKPLLNASVLLVHGREVPTMMGLEALPEPEPAAGAGGGGGVGDLTTGGKGGLGEGGGGGLGGLGGGEGDGGLS